MRYSILLMFGLFLYSPMSFATLIDEQILLESYTDGSCDVQITVDATGKHNYTMMTILVEQIKTDKLPPCSLGAAQMTSTLKSALNVHARLGYGPIFVITLDNIKPYRWINKYQEENIRILKNHPPRTIRDYTLFKRVKSPGFLQDLLKPIQPGLAAFNMTIDNARCANLVTYKPGKFSGQCFIYLDGPWSGKKDKRD